MNWYEAAQNLEEPGVADKPSAFDDMFGDWKAELDRRGKVVSTQRQKSS